MTPADYFLEELKKPGREFMDDPTWGVKEIHEDKEAAHNDK